MRAEFHLLGAPDVVGWASWTGNGIEIGGSDQQATAAIRRIFRATPAVVDDPSLRPAGSSGPVILPPASLHWFRAVAEARAGAEGLAVRFVPDRSGVMGWDPAGAYRTFAEAIDRRERVGTSDGPAA